jgi:hypothetical protein
MKLCRFADDHGEIHTGLMQDEHLIADLSSAGVASLSAVLEREDLEQLAGKIYPTSS